MKLYATTTSERASKGQGGNDFLHVKIINEKREVIADIMVENHSGLLGLSYFIDKTKIVSIGEVEKGKSQKSEKCSQNHCNELGAVGGMCLEHYQLDL